MPEQIVVGFGWAIIAVFFGGIALLIVGLAVAAYFEAVEWIRTRSWWDE